MTKTAIKSVGFTVEGLWLSEFARERVSEGAWEKALKMLMQDVGCSHEQAVAICTGRANFTGEAGVGAKDEGLGWEDLAEDHPTAVSMQKRLDYMYGSVFNHRDEYWKPYATVHGWDKHDYEFMLHHTGACNHIDGYTGRRSTLSLANGHLRSFYYANNTERDMIVSLGTAKHNQFEVLCERTTMPPIWMEFSVNRPAEFLWGRHKAEKLNLPVRGTETGDLKVDSIPEDAPSVIAAKEAAAAAEEAARPDEVIAAESKRITKEFLDAITAAKSPKDIGAAERAYQTQFDALRQGAIPNEVWDEKQKSHDIAQEAAEKIMADRVRDQAEKMGGWMTLKLEDKEDNPFTPASIKVPTNPFLHWCLHGFRFEDYDKTPPEWPWVAGAGWKMQGDDPYHTDWMLGAGIPLKETYDRCYASDKPMTIGEAIRDASYNIRSKIIRDWTGVKFAILSKGSSKWLGGEVFHPGPNEPCPAGSIAVIPHAGPEYQLAMETACKVGGENKRCGLVIAETGGKLAHLAIVGRELDCTVLMVPDALKKYKPGRRIYVDMTEMLITEGL